MFYNPYVLTRKLVSHNGKEYIFDFAYKGEGLGFIVFVENVLTQEKFRREFDSDCEDDVIRAVLGSL